MLIDPVNKSIFSALRAFVLSVVPIAPDHVIKGLGNGTPTPTGGYIALTELRKRALSTNIRTNDTLGQTNSVMRPTEYDVQIDCYGPDSGDWATMITTMFRDQYGCDSFTASLPGSAPLFCTDPRQAALVNGEENYQQRWVFSALLQYNPVITVPQQSATVVDVDTKSVDAYFPPQEAT